MVTSLWPRILERGVRVGTGSGIGLATSIADLGTFVGSGVGVGVGVESGNFDTKIFVGKTSTNGRSVGKFVGLAPTGVSSAPRQATLTSVRDNIPIIHNIFPRMRLHTFRAPA